MDTSYIEQLRSSAFRKPTRSEAPLLVSCGMISQRHVIVEVGSFAQSRMHGSGADLGGFRALARKPEFGRAHA